MPNSFKPYCGISKVENGYTVDIRVQSEDKDDFNPHKEYVYTTFEDAVAKLNEYFQQYP